VRIMSVCNVSYTNEKESRRRWIQDYMGIKKRRYKRVNLYAIAVVEDATTVRSFGYRMTKL
jgi:hypothetical protein